MSIATNFSRLGVAGIAIGPWVAALVIAIVVFAGLLFLRGLLKRSLGRLAARTASELDDLITDLVRKTNIFFLLVVALYAGSLSIAIPPRLLDVIRAAVAIAFLLQVGVWGNRVIAFALQRMVRARDQADQSLATALGALNFISRVVLWTTLVLLAMAALHLNVTALVAGLGVGGVAVALAVQNILADLFASLSILIDKPFALGHFIVVDDLAGTVEHVGIKSTRVRSLSGEEIVLSNGDLLKSRIHNYKRLMERRILFSFGVTYDTPYEALVAVPGMVREIITAIPTTRFDRAHFKEFGASSLNFEVVYFVLNPDYNLYMDIQQQINLGLVRRLSEAKVEFAFPTSTVYVYQPQR